MHKTRGWVAILNFITTKVKPIQHASQPEPLRSITATTNDTRAWTPISPTSSPYPPSTTTQRERKGHAKEMRKLNLPRSRNSMFTPRRSNVRFATIPEACPYRSLRHVRCNQAGPPSLQLTPLVHNPGRPPPDRKSKC
jgi:hypothetical protein